MYNRQVKAAWNAVFAEAGQDAADQPVAGDDSNETAVLKSEDGALKTYTATTKGFQGDNEYEIVIDTDKQEVVSVKMTSFNRCV